MTTRTAAAISATRLDERLSTARARTARTEAQASLASTLDQALTRQAAALADATGIPEPLGRLTLIHDLSQHLTAQRSSTGAQAHHEGTFLATVAYAAGLTNTSNPRAWSGFNQALQALQDHQQTLTS